MRCNLKEKKEEELDSRVNESLRRLPDGRVVFLVIVLRHKPLTSRK